MTYSMLLLSTVVIIGLLETSDAFHSFASIQSVFHVHHPPQMWNHTQVYNNLYIPLENSEGYFLGSCQTTQTTTGEDWSLDEEERLADFPSVMTNSSGALIGGSCTGGLFLFCVVIYILYKLLRPEPPRIEPICPRCRNVSCSAPPSYYEGSFSPPSIAPSIPCSCQL
ncbi:hypothetical protein ACROYT_G024491 [Oculina patagonica]